MRERKDNVTQDVSSELSHSVHDSKLKVLVMDHDEMNRDVCNTMLANLSNDVVVAKDGQEEFFVKISGF